ncbi:sensor histidine kinase [Clostridium ganghwense]|uniref:histidine kinase n=1 Tax=Clostridium ganghwense TaxID=312089 RepID=A0ABT4CW24_9CLOT|nr:HAMP domain-containing sensor histidine kinase [Clostridium ganghwense]MCY6372241.1 HAMP domain-containing sensor histidine kinase [Clostridium ganghwense]
MKSKSIVYKLFFITVIVFTVFIVIQMSLQSTFFSKFYIKEKTKIIEKNIEDFSKKYLDSNWSINDGIKEIDNFIKENNSAIIITNEVGFPKNLYMYSFYNSVVIIKDKNDNYYKIPTEYIVDSNDGTEFKTKKGDSIYVEGINVYDNEDIINPIIIESKGKKYVSKAVDIDEVEIYDYNLDNGDEEIIYGQSEEVKKIKGTVVYADNSNDISSDMIYKETLLMEQVDSWFYNEDKVKGIVNNEIISYSYNEPESKTQNLVCIKPLTTKKGNKEYIFVLTSLQPVDEAIGIMKKYYGYMFLLAILFIVILSFAYSKMISKPLIKINNVAKNMANLDFSVCCEVKSEDELGSLSKSLNTLSKNLDNNMRELKKANEKLKDDIEKEKEQDKIRKEFVASVSHELKTPLGIMKGFAEGIKDGIYEDKKDYYLEVIIDEIEKMNGLVLDMLELSKLEAGAHNLEKSNFDIKDIIVNTSDKFRHIAEDKNLKVDLDIDCCEVYADAKKIEQVIVNLFSNAIRYSENSGFIKVKTEVKDKEINVYIENSGSHIPEEQLHKIWHRFYRVEKSRSKALGGTGLGLPIVKNILEMHKSKFGVRNTEQGVEFYFSLLEA